VTTKDQEELDKDSKPAAIKNRSPKKKETKKKETTWGVPARKDNSPWRVSAQRSSGVSQGRKGNSAWGVPPQPSEYSPATIAKASEAILKDHHNQELKESKKRKH
jgi:hypothetical protein